MNPATEHTNLASKILKHLESVFIRHLNPDILDRLGRVPGQRKAVAAIIAEHWPKEQQQATPHATEAKPVVPAAPPVPPQQNTVLTAADVEKLMSAGKIRAKAAAEKLGVELDQLSAILESGGLEIKAGGWLGRVGETG